MDSRLTSMSGRGKILSLPPEIIKLILRALGQWRPTVDRRHTPSRRILVASLVHSSWTLLAQEEAILSASQNQGFDVSSYHSHVYEAILSKMERCPTLARQVKKMVLHTAPLEMKRAFLRICISLADLEIVEDGLHGLSWDDVARSAELKKLSVSCYGQSQMLPSSFVAPGLRSITDVSLGCLSAYMPGVKDYLKSDGGALIAHLPLMTALAWPEPSSWDVGAAVSFLSSGIPGLTRLELLANVQIHLEPIGDYWSRLLPLANNLKIIRVSWEHYLSPTSWPAFISALPERCRLTELAIYDPDSYEREYEDDDDSSHGILPYRRTHERLERDLERAPFRRLEVLRVFGKSGALHSMEDNKRLEELEGMANIETMCERKNIQLDFFLPP